MRRGLPGTGSAAKRCKLKLLVMDTCGEDGSLVLVDLAAAEVVVEQATLVGRSTSERLLPELRRMLRARGWGVRDLGAVGVVAGPGSFTGARVGLAAAKGLCEAGERPLVTVSRLEVLAAKAAGADGVVHALLRAGRGEFFHGRFEARREAGEDLRSKAEVLEEVRRGGRAVVSEGEVAGELAELDPMVVDPLTAADAVGLMLRRVRAGQISDVGLSDAIYLRRTEMEVVERLRQRAVGPR